MTVSIRACKYCKRDECICEVKGALTNSVGLMRRIEDDNPDYFIICNQNLIYRCKNCVPLAKVGDKIRYSFDSCLKKEYEGVVFKIDYLEEKPVYYQVEVFGDTIEEINEHIESRTEDWDEGLRMEETNGKYYLSVKYDCLELIDYMPNDTKARK